MPLGESDGVANERADKRAERVAFDVADARAFAGALDVADTGADALAGANGATEHEPDTRADSVAVEFANAFASELLMPERPQSDGRGRRNCRRVVQVHPR